MTVTPVQQQPVGFEALVEWLDETSLRYEVIDGAILVSPPTTLRHEDATGSLFTQLRAACPAHLLVVARFGWRYDQSRPTSFLDPDITAVARDDVDLDSDVHAAVPLLVVETRSPSTWRVDEGVKKDLYAAGGVQAYWLLDPRAPRLRILELHDGEYIETARLEGQGELTVDRPFPVTIRL